MNVGHTVAEFRDQWLPHVSDAGLDRLIELFEAGSPLLIHGAFSKACAMGCIATHIAWHHPATSTLNDEAGVLWLTRVAKLNPATSRVILAWDRDGRNDWALRAELLRACVDEKQRREGTDRYDKPSDEYTGSRGVSGITLASACDAR
jgi:hypothetical protein